MFVASPFPHHGPVPPDELRGRDELIDDLVERVTAHRPTVLIAPRRFGKTSVLGAVTSDLGETVTVVTIDLYELRSWADFAARLDDGLAAVVGPGRRTLDRIAASLEINLGLVKTLLERPPRPAPDATADRLLELLVRHAAATPTVVVLDEFSSIVRVDGAAGLLRTRLQHHYREIGLLFAGSEPSTMRMLFADTDQPFYGQADLVEVPPLSLAALTELVDEGFEGRAPAGLAARIHAFTGGHPQRSMQLADTAWSLVGAPSVEPGSSDALPTADEIWPDVVDRCRRATADGHEVRFAGLSPADQAAMRLAAADGVLFGRDADLLSLSRSSAQLARRRLLERGQVIEAGDRIRVVDPLYADWIRHRFPL